MNVHLKPISFRKYSLIIIYPLLVMAVIIWCMEFYFERVYGDLTRIGNFPERYFGWQSLQPAISSEQFKDYSLAEADILVIGDSFSISRIWQTRLIADGLKLSTIEWKELKTNESLPADLGETLRASGFKGHYVIIQSIERLFQNRMKSLAKESHRIVKKDIINSSFPLYPFTQRERFSLDKPNGGNWGVKALYNTIKLFLDLPERYLKSGAVQAIKLDGCQFFSHRLCNYTIFVDGSNDSDFKKETFTAIDNVLTVNKNLNNAGIQPIWAIIPDKATVYLGYGALNQYPYQNIWKLFSQYPELIAPDLGELFIQKSRTMKDFYMPNDTHLSTNGFLSLGDMMLNELRKLQTSQNKPL
jgi:hypothetical protein